MFRKRSDRLEAELRGNRPEPRDELVRHVVARVEGSRPRARAFRVAFAAGLTVVALVVFGALGGLGYASSGISVVKAPVKAVKKVVSPKKNAAPKKAAAPAKASASAADAQYAQGFTVCHKPPGNPTNSHTLSVGSQQAYNAHLAHGNSAGPCANDRRRRSSPNRLRGAGRAAPSDDQAASRSSSPRLTSAQSSA